jgi:hypothetical protein
MFRGESGLARKTAAIWRPVKCTFNISKRGLKIQERSVIRDFCLRRKTNRQICVELERGYCGETLHHMAVETWPATRRALKETVHDADRPGKPFLGNSNEAVVRILERQPHSPSRATGKVLWPQNRRFFEFNMSVAWIPRLGSEFTYCPREAQFSEKVRFSQGAFEMTSSRSEAPNI